MERYTTGKYLKSEDALYEVLHQKHPGIARKDFCITASSSDLCYRKQTLCNYRLA
jgi:hypothetical protein